MEEIKTPVTFDKDNLKKIRRALFTPFSNRIFLCGIVVAVLVLTFLLISSRYELIIALVIVVSYPISYLVATPFIKQRVLLNKIKALRQKNKIENTEYTIVMSFCSDFFEMRDSIDYENNIILQLNYSDFRWLAETNTHYVILTKTRTGYSEWFNDFAIADKDSIDQAGRKDEFIEFLKSKCENLRLQKHKLG